MINFDTLKEWANDDVDTMKEILHLFLQNTPPMLHQLELAVNTEDWEEIYKFAHKLKSSYGIVTIGNSLDLITDMEVLSYKKISISEIQDKMKQVLEQYAAAEIDCHEFLQ